MLRNSAALSIALLVCALMLPMETAAAQQTGKTGLHDDTSGRLTEIPIRKENLAFADASADLTFDVDYVYKSTTLVGEPLLLCGAKLSNPNGIVSFTHRDTNHQVEVTPQNAEKINPHHLDLLVEYRLPDSRVFYASCDTGIVGTWAREAYNLSSSPSWGRFLCEVAGSIVIANNVSMRPRPNRIDREWCASMQGRYLDADAAKELFRTRELRASGFVVASLSLDVADLVLDQTRTGLAERIAQRMEAQLEGALADSKPGMLASAQERETWEALNGEVRARLDAAAATESAGERARALRDAIRTVLAAESSDDGSAETLRALQAALAGRLSDQVERDFAERERDEASQMRDERDRIAGSVETQLQSARAAAEASPEFRFAGQGGVADIVREIRRFGRTGPAAFSPDGRYLASADRDTIHLWDVATGQEIRNFIGHQSGVWTVAFSPDGRYLLSGSGGTTKHAGDIRLWNVSSGSEVRRIAAHAKDSIVGVGTAWSVAYSPDGRHFVSGGSDNVVRLWDAASGVEIQSFAGHETVHLSRGTVWADIRSVAFSPDGQYVASGAVDNTARLWDIKSGAETTRFIGHEKPKKGLPGVAALAFSPDGRHLLTSGHDNTVRLWDANSGAQVRSFTGGGGIFSPDGRYVLLANNGIIHVREMESGNEIRRLESETKMFTPVLSPDGSYAVFRAGEDLVLWGPAE